MPLRDVEDPLEHRVSQSAGLSVLLTWMIGREQDKSTIQGHDLPMSKEGSRGRELQPADLQGLQTDAEGNLAEGHDDPHIVQQVKLLQEKRATAAQLGWDRPVAGRRTAHRGGNVAVSET